jgi:hypothetical protein
VRGHETSDHASVCGRRALRLSAEDHALELLMTLSHFATAIDAALTELTFEVFPPGRPVGVTGRTS